MAHPQHDPASIRFSQQLYTLLLRAYPAGFRREYGPLMLQVFGDGSRDAIRRSGAPGLLGFWGRTLFDWFKTVLEENLRRDTEMTRTKFIRLSGWGMVLGAIVFLLAMALDAATIRGVLYRIIGPPVTSERFRVYMSISESLGLLIGAVGVALILQGLHGLNLKYAAQMSSFGKNSLSISIYSGWVALLSIFGLFYYEAAWSVFTLGLAIQFSALAVFGINAMHTGLMPRGNFLPIAAGAYVPLFVIVSLIMELLTGGGWLELPRWLEVPLVTSSFLSLAMLGYVLQLDAAN